MLRQAPNLAQGACLAIEDALELAGQLRRWRGARAAPMAHGTWCGQCGSVVPCHLHDERPGDAAEMDGAALRTSALPQDPPSLIMA